ncbi:hypothetical protein [Priestia aryabhattai]|uniref:hypothetical protein n=1 Tax=Priestia aryabhattai TaxID=412384 RepID=UPI0021AE1700|nr:hypothetical protein [Priestia aryabhattai]
MLVDDVALLLTPNTGATGATGSTGAPTSVNLIYVANADSNTVSVISGNTNSVIATVPVGFGPRGVRVNP